MLVHRVPLRSAVVFTAVIAATVFSMGSPTVHAAGSPAATADTSIVGVEDSTPTSSVPNEFLDLERSLSECISSNPPPGCGRAPTSPGDRGGWQQLVLFGVMMSGMAVIFWRVSRAVRHRYTVAEND